MKKNNYTTLGDKKTLCKGNLQTKMSKRRKKKQLKIEEQNENYSDLL